MSPLEDALQALEVDVSTAVAERLQRYLDTLESWNRRMNLTALSGLERARRLVAEPLWVAATLSPRGHYVDVGSGNGSPAIPWLAAHAFARGAMVESRQRRAVFLQLAARRLALPASAYPQRLDAFVAAPPFPAADWVTLQGVRFTEEIHEQIRQIAAEHTQIVWFTHDRTPPAPPVQTLEIPGTDRCAMVFEA
jgi:16S rRNA G527 N7-methylase RsmG